MHPVLSWATDFFSGADSATDHGANMTGVRSGFLSVLYGGNATSHAAKLSVGDRGVGCSRAKRKRERRSTRFMFGACAMRGPVWVDRVCHAQLEGFDPPRAHGGDDDQGAPIHGIGRVWRPDGTLAKDAVSGH